MKNRLLYIVLALVGLVLMGIALGSAIFENSFDIFKLVYGFFCLLYGGYKIIHSDKKE